ncbi:MAG: hypothetical protein ACHRXM_08720 [Isosphaerales bacterium]
MNIMIGDTIVYDKEIGIVENRSGSTLTVRFPENGNRRIPVLRNAATPLGDLIYQARVAGRPLRLANRISLAGDSTLADLVALFGYSTGLMRTESLNKVLKQLSRAGLEIVTETDRRSRDDKFKVNLPSIPLPREEDDEGDDDRTQTETKQQTPTISKLPDPFWPSALGLDRRRELEFLRALWESDPILCLLYVPSEAQAQAWIQGTWEGIIGWAYRSAQRFIWGHEDSAPNIQVRVGPAALLHTYLKPSVLDSGAPRLEGAPHTLNLITIKRGLELPTDFARLSAVWPGPIFEFKPDYKGEPSADIQERQVLLRSRSRRGRESSLPAMRANSLARRWLESRTGCCRRPLDGRRANSITQRSAQVCPEGRRGSVHGGCQPVLRPGDRGVDIKPSAPDVSDLT